MSPFFFPFGWMYLPVGDRGYDKGFVRCTDCQNLEAYIGKNDTTKFFRCKLGIVKMDRLRADWRRCQSFVLIKGERIVHKRA